MKTEGPVTPMAGNEKYLSKHSGTSALGIIYISQINTTTRLLYEKQLQNCWTNCEALGL